jgi:hypothetical protein
MYFYVRNVILFLPDSLASYNASSTFLKISLLLVSASLITVTPRLIVIFGNRKTSCLIYKIRTGGLGLKVLLCAAIIEVCDIACPC